jgi:hypothetical protein
MLASDLTTFARFFDGSASRSGSRAVTTFSIETALTRFSTFSHRLFGEAVSGHYKLAEEEQ